MSRIGIICEYNPFHNGHLRQLELARQAAGENGAVVCLMSGNYVQRGAPAVFPKRLRAEAAVRCGADLVLELPLTLSVSSAEGFADGGVAILTELGCDRLCFGTETEDLSALMKTAEANLDPAFDGLIREELASGIPYPAARQRALQRLGAGQGVSSPNDILAVEYLKAILRRNASVQPLALHRPGQYHSRTLDPESPSATALRGLLEAGSSSWKAAVPQALQELYASAPAHTWAAGERAVLALVRTLPDEAFASVPFGSEGLWSKLMHACRGAASVDEILEQTKSKRYTLARIRRMLLCACLGLTAEDLDRKPPYVRVLAFRDRGRALLHDLRTDLPLINAGQTPPDPFYYALERRASDLYGLFAVGAVPPAGEEDRLRIFYSRP